MTEARIATFSGGTVGLDRDAAATVAQLQHPQQNSGPKAENLLRLHPEHPFGVTVIIGGTNVRFCLSVPDRADPVFESVRWTQLREELAPELKKAGRTFEESKDEVYRSIAQKFAAFVLTHSPEGAEHPPLQNLCAFNFSIAGIVEGEGFNAKVSTTNTAIPMAEEQVALEVLGAINADLSERGWPRVNVKNVSVMNDAAAGLMGEHLGGALRGFDNGLYLILGTGVGSFGLVKGKLSYQFAELGHRVTRNEMSEAYTYHDDDELAELMDDRNQFKAASTEEWYAENELAGPWAAVKFLKHVKNDEGLKKCFQFFAEQVSEKVGPTRSYDELKKIVDELADLGYRDVTKWAVSSPSDVIKGVNSILFCHDANRIANAVECDLSIKEIAGRGAKPTEKANDYIKKARELRLSAARVRKELEKLLPSDERYAELQAEAQASEQEAVRVTEKAKKSSDLGNAKFSKALTLAAYTEWQKYFKELARFLETAYDAMKVRDAAPQRIVIAGGIGELSATYAPQWKGRIMELFADFAPNIPNAEETVVFSTMSPEAREAYVTTAAVQEAFEEYKKKQVSLPNANGLLGSYSGETLH
jgi:hypothetical protein